MADLRRCLGSMLVCGFDGDVLPDDFRTILQANSLGGVILFARNYSNSTQLSELTAQIHSLSEVPVLLAADQEGGRVVRFAGDFPIYPSPRYYGLRRDVAGLLTATARTAEHLRTAGVNLNLIPVCDLAPDDSAHVIHSRSYSSDPEEMSNTVRLQIECLRKQGVLSCAKHFPGLASAYGDPHYVVSRSDQSLADFRQRDYIPFRAAIDAQVDMIMITHLLVPQIDAKAIATFSSIFVRQELRDHLGFAGLVITDDLLMAGALEGVSAAEAGIKAVLAGSDLLIYGDLSNNIIPVTEAITQAAASNPALAYRLEESSDRIQRFKLEQLKAQGENPDPTKRPNR
jgi:beta-N-acetylhexosaminidase